MSNKGLAKVSATYFGPDSEYELEAGNFRKLAKEHGAEDNDVLIERYRWEVSIPAGTPTEAFTRALSKTDCFGELSIKIPVEWMTTGQPQATLEA